MDISEPSAQELCAAVRLGFAKRGKLMVFHAFLLPGRGSMVLAGLSSEAIASDVTATAVQARADMGQYLRGLDFDLGSQVPPIVVHDSTPAEALRDTVGSLSPDLVVLGTRAYGASGRLLLGSTTEEALRTLDCNVLAVPPAAE